MGFHGPPAKVQELLVKAMQNVVRAKPIWDGILDEFNHAETIKEHTTADKYDTAILFAAAVGKAEVVKNLLDHLKAVAGEDMLLEILMKGDNDGNTALHLAAARGNVKICEHIASCDPNRLTLFSLKNEQGETPLFLAAKRGRRRAFFFLEKLYKDGTKGGPSLPLLINEKTGDSILHIVIFEENYSFAVELLEKTEEKEKYRKLVPELNKEGLSPIHALALQPDSFRSSCKLQFDIFDNNIYFFGSLISKLLRVIYDILGWITNKICGGGKNDPDEFEEADIQRNVEHELGQFMPKYPNIPDDKASKCLCMWRPKKMCSELLSETLMVTKELLMVTFLLASYVLVWRRLKLISNLKIKHIEAEQLLGKLIEYSSLEEYKKTEAHMWSQPEPANKNKQDQNQWIQPQYLKETPLLTAARLGIVEIVFTILQKFPSVIQEFDCDEKNVALLAAEHRRKHLYMELLQWKSMIKESVLYKRDKDGNSALHLASKYNENRGWFIPGAALQMTLEIQWPTVIKEEMPSHTFASLRNNVGETPEDIFSETHKALIEKARQWLTDTCTAYSVVSTLIVTVAFSTVSNVPGSYNDYGTPELRHEAGFKLFAAAAVVALCASMTSTAFFLAILTTRYEQEDFERTIPYKFCFGLFSLFLAIASMLISFGSGFYYNVRIVPNVAYPIFAVMCLPFGIYVLAQLNLFFDITRAIFFMVYGTRQ